jgi:hypothetical protein
MPRAKKETKEIATEVKKSPAYLAFEAFIETYKTQNPQKYELKKEELLAKLNTL